MNLPSDFQRLLPFVLVGVLAIAGLALVVRTVGGGGGGESSAADAQQLIRAAFDNDPKSGVLDLGFAFTLELATQGSQRQPQTATVNADGPFVEPTSKDPFALGEQDLRMSQTEEGKTTKVRIVSTGEKGYIQARGQWYELTARQSQRVFNNEQTRKHEGVLEDDEFNVPSWTQAPKVDGTARVDGVETDRVVGALNVDAFLADLFDDTPTSDPEFWQNASKQGEVELFVGKEDKILRKVAITGQGALQGPGGAARVTMRFDVALRDVNKPQRITAPKGALPAGAVNRLPRSALGPQADAVLGKKANSGGGGTKGSGSNRGGGRARGQRNSEAYVNCVQQASDTVALEKCQALLR